MEYAKKEPKHMTAEIVVLNREGIAMASDSAVTSSLGDIDKISSSANKLFSLSDYHPVGIMIYGDASFMGIPWETIIKIYRSKVLPRSGFPTLNEYAKHFTSFLCYENIKFHPLAEGKYIMAFAFEIFGNIRGIIFENIEKKSKSGENIDDNGLLRLTHNTIDNNYAYFQDMETEYISREQSKLVLSKYHKELQSAIDTAFNGLPVNKNYRAILKQLLIEAFARYIPDNLSSGLVIAGFGEEELLPVVKALKIEGIVRFRQNNADSEILKYEEDKEYSSSSDIDAAVIAFAQHEMVCRFMEGVDPEYIQAEEQFLNDLCKDYAKKVVSQLDKYTNTEKKKILERLSRYGKRMTEEFSKNMKGFTSEYFTEPTVSAVGRLTKKELAAMAEALVYVTSLKRKVSSDSETVAEPIDVALISKGDGFIWIKRKHYFEPNLNPVYFMNRNKEINNGNYENEKENSSKNE